jgi:large subunit ribosomal protein L24e
MPLCSFCGKDAILGRGVTYIQNTGKVLHLCSSKCRKNMLSLKRKARNLKWTTHYEKGKK